MFAITCFIYYTGVFSPTTNGLSHLLVWFGIYLIKNHLDYVFGFLFVCSGLDFLLLFFAFGLVWSWFLWCLFLIGLVGGCLLLV